MINSILGIKLGQTQQFTADGRMIPVTKILAGPCTVVQVKTQDKDGYWAVKLGLGTKRDRKKEKTGKETPRFLREFKIDENEKLEKGQLIKVEELFQVSDKVQVTGTSNGKGFAGVIKRWKFAGGPRTHGQSDRERAPGSIGQTTTPGRVYKGKRMAGRMGGERITIKGLQVVEVKPEENLLVVKGLVPGRKGNLVLISKI